MGAPMPAKKRKEKNLTWTVTGMTRLPKEGGGKKKREEKGEPRSELADRETKPRKGKGKKRGNHQNQPS